MARRPALRVGVRIDGARETLKAFNDLPKEANKQLKEKSNELSRSLVQTIRQAAQSDESPQAALFAKTVRAKKDRVPAIVAGGERRVGRNRVPAWQVLFGGEFGSDRFPQFKKSHRGPEGGPIFQTVDREQAAISDAWNEAADAILSTFTRGGGGR